MLFEPNLPPAVQLALDSYLEPHVRATFTDLARETKQQCKVLLWNKAVNPIVTCRTKDYDSLKTKMIAMLGEPEFSDWVAKRRPILEYPDMGDLAGVRIGLTYPSEVVTVVKRLAQCFNIEYLFGTVTGGRTAIYERNRDVERHNEGRWSDGTYNWHNPGFKSWQMIVSWKHPPKEEFIGLHVEIQVGDKASQEWGNMQHGILYKRSGIIVTEDLMREIDKANTNATLDAQIKDDVKRYLDKAIADAEARDLEEFKDFSAFAEWFRQTYLNQLDENMREIYMSRSALKRIYRNLLRYQRVINPADARKIIEHARLEELNKPQP